MLSHSLIYLLDMLMLFNRCRRWLILSASGFFLVLTIYHPLGSTCYRLGAQRAVQQVHSKSKIYSISTTSCATNSH